MPGKLHVYEVRPRRDHRGVDLISNALPFGRLWYDTPDHAIGYAIPQSRSADAVIRARARHPLERERLEVSSDEVTTTRYDRAKSIAAALSLNIFSLFIRCVRIIFSLWKSLSSLFAFFLDCCL